MHVPGNTGSRALLSPVFVIKSEYLRECSASRVWPYMHHLRIMSLVKCWVNPAPGFAALRSVLSAKAAICALVIPDEHLSRESRKLTVMIQRETGQPLEDSSESIGFLRINEGPVSRSRTYAHRIRMNTEVPGAI